MIRAELHRLIPSDTHVKDLKHFAPSDPGCFSVLVYAAVGIAGEVGDDFFVFQVCSPRALADDVARCGYFLPRGYLLLETYDYHMLWNAIANLCAEIRAPDWATFREHFGKYGIWESDNTTTPLTCTERGEE